MMQPTIFGQPLSPIADEQNKLQLSFIQLPAAIHVLKVSDE
jgi:hypothetical protein